MAVTKDRLPQLEAEKKEAIASRDFRGAKELASEISETMAEIDSADSKLAILRSCVKTGRSDLVTARQLEDSLAMELQEAETAATISMNELTSAIAQSLDESIESIVSASVRGILETFRASI